MKHSPLLFALAFACAALLQGPRSLAQVAAGTTATAISRAIRSRIEPTAAQPLDMRSARDWGLRPEEWVRYRTLMQGPLGILSPHLDPLTALGIEARSNAEREHYADLEVRMEGERVAKLLAYQRTYDAAWRRLYPTLRPMGFAASPRASNDVKSAQRLAVFVKDPCPACVAQVQALEAQGQAFDVYMVGLQDDTQLRAWAARAHLDPARVRAGIITLNHDAGRWLAIGGEGSLPAVLENVGGQWQRE